MIKRYIKILCSVVFIFLCSSCQKVDTTLLLGDWQHKSEGYTCDLHFDSESFSAKMDAETIGEPDALPNYLNLEVLESYNSWRLDDTRLIVGKEINDEKNMVWGMIPGAEMKIIRLDTAELVIELVDQKLVFTRINKHNANTNSEP